MVFIVGIRRQPKEIWHNNTRPKVFERDGGKCVKCKLPVTLKTCHIDHIQSGIIGSNHIDNLRTLCRQCHVLRADIRHRGMVANALKKGIIPANWRELVWEG
jgi:5-methylcytosine-specific restriction endonuclease McrA